MTDRVNATTTDRTAATDAASTAAAASDGAVSDGAAIAAAVTDDAGPGGGAPGDAAVRVVGRRELVLPVESDRVAAGGVDLALRTGEFAFRCAGGRRIADRWTGVGLADLIDAADAPPGTTHLFAEGADGYRACAEIARALRGLLALDGESSLPAALPRLIVPGVDGERTVKRVRRIEFRALDPGDDPGEREQLTPA